MDITQLDKKLLIHVAAELVIIGGIAFWLNGKINSKDAVIEEQAKQIKLLQDRLLKIELFLTNTTNNIQTEEPPQVNSVNKKKKKKKAQSPTASEEEFKSEEDEILV